MIDSKLRTGWCERLRFTHGFVELVELVATMGSLHPRAFAYMSDCVSEASYPGLVQRPPCQFAHWHRCRKQPCRPLKARLAGPACCWQLHTSSQSIGLDSTKSWDCVVGHGALAFGVQTTVALQRTADNQGTDSRGNAVQQLHRHELLRTLEHLLLHI